MGKEPVFGGNDIIDKCIAICIIKMERVGTTAFLVDQVSTALIGFFLALSDVEVRRLTL